MSQMFQSNVLTAPTQAPSCSIASQALKSPIMSVSHHNVTCTAGEWAALNTSSMIASKVREGISVCTQ